MHERVMQINSFSALHSVPFVSDLKLYSTVPEHAEPISELHSQTKELERDTTVHVTVTVHC